MEFSYPIQTRYSETAQDRIIHHSSYVVYLEEARIAFFRSLGCDINELEKRGIFCIVADLSLSYHKPLDSGEKVDIHVSLASRGKVRFSLNYALYRGETLVTTAQTTHCFLNASFKPIAIPEELCL